jgi:hypothetical protein
MGPPGAASSDNVPVEWSCPMAVAACRDLSHAAPSELDNLTPLRAASTAEASEIHTLEERRFAVGGERR